MAVGTGGQRHLREIEQCLNLYVLIHNICVVRIEPIWQVLTKPSWVKIWIKSFYKTRSCLDWFYILSLPQDKANDLIRLTHTQDQVNDWISLAHSHSQNQVNDFIHLAQTQDQVNDLLISFTHSQDEVNDLLHLTHTQDQVNA